MEKIERIPAAIAHIIAFYNSRTKLDFEASARQDGPGKYIVNVERPAAKTHLLVTFVKRRSGWTHTDIELIVDDQSIDIKTGIAEALRRISQKEIDTTDASSVRDTSKAKRNLGLSIKEKTVIRV